MLRTAPEFELLKTVNFIFSIFTEISSSLSLQPCPQNSFKNSLQTETSDNYSNMHKNRLHRALARESFAQKGRVKINNKPAEPLPFHASINGWIWKTGAVNFFTALVNCQSKSEFQHFVIN